MQIIRSQYVVVNNHIKSLPLIPWHVMKVLLWDIEDDLFEKMEVLASCHQWHFNYFIDSFSHIKNYAIVITDMNQRIVCSSKKFCKLSGYTSNELIGNYPNMLQGKHTNTKVKNTMKTAIGESTPVTARLINYRKDGTLYGCELNVYPIFNEKKETTHFIAFEKEYFV